MVFDQPLDQAPDLKLIPKLVKNWSLAPDGLSLALDFRDDVNFHGTTKASFNPETKGAKIEYENIPMCLVPPRPRVYTND